jgi:hypothetical protein
MIKTNRLQYMIYYYYFLTMFLFVAQVLPSSDSKWWYGAGVVILLADTTYAEKWRCMSLQKMPTIRELYLTTISIPYPPPPRRLFPTSFFCC